MAAKGGEEGGTILVTGASGLLGRRLMSRLSSRGRRLVGWSLNRTPANCIKVDLTLQAGVRYELNALRPDVMIHSAAIRRPDQIKEDEVLANSINVVATELLASYAAENDVLMVLISTDYVFDGKEPPYAENATPNPLNKYGEQKLAAEKVVERLLGAGKNYAILRIPILYGPVEYLGEGAVDAILATILKGVERKAEVKMDNDQLRYPTHVDDVADVVDLLISKSKQSDFGGIYHWSSAEVMTKFGMSKTMVEVLGLGDAEISEVDADGGTRESAVVRPHDTHLSAGRLLQMRAALPKRRFADGVAACYKSYVQ